MQIPTFLQIMRAVQSPGQGGRVILDIPTLSPQRGEITGSRSVTFLTKANVHVSLSLSLFLERGWRGGKRKANHLNIEDEFQSKIT